MATSKLYLVPVDFSRTSGRALNYAIRLARETQGRLLLVHVITDSPAYVPINLRARKCKEVFGTLHQEDLVRQLLQWVTSEFRVSMNFSNPES